MNDLEYCKRRISELEEECVKKQNEINQLEESCGRMKAKVDTYVNFILPRATEEARKMIDSHQYPGIRIATCEEWENRGKDNQSEVEKYRKAFEDAKKERDCQIAEYKSRAEKDKTEIERAKTTINQIDDILEKLFGVRHDTADKPDEFEKILSERAKGNITDFLPTEPIKVADVLINAEGEYERNPPEKAFCGTDKGTYRIFEVSELRQIAEHLLVYCNHNGEVEE